MALAWPIIVKRAKKKYGYDTIPYLCVFEATKRGEPHLHILCRVKWISQKWLSEQLKDLTGAYIVDIRKVKSQKQIAHYMAKYVGKEPHRFKGCKRYWRTQNWLVVPAERPEEDGIWTDKWWPINNSLPGLERRWRALGFDTAMEGTMLVAMKQGPPDEHREGWTHV